MTRTPHRRFLWLLAATILATAGCGKKVAMTPVEGRVTLDGKPLQLGAVMVQPKAGPAAQAKINPDGTFRLGTFKPDDGAIVGPATVRVICRKDITQPGGERAYGPSLIPEKYARFETSGIAVEIKRGMPLLEIPLTSK